MPTYGSDPAAPVTTMTIGEDTIYPTSIRYSDSDTAETAAHMQDHKQQRFLTTNTKTLSVSWFGPTMPSSLKVGTAYTVTITAGSSTISLTNARCAEVSHEASARGAWQCSATFELDES